MKIIDTSGCNSCAKAQFRSKIKNRGEPSRISHAAKRVLALKQPNKIILRKRSIINT